MIPLAKSAQPVIIIGAGRSGTNMLRDVLTKLGGIDTWPCDEINYIWRHGNRDEPTDEFTASHATNEVVSFIRSAFSSRIKSSGLDNFPAEQRYILEKTCANSLRVPFVEAALPEAKYIHLIRDGRDVIASARKRWQAPLDVPYLLAKARYVPISDLFYYASRYLGNRLSKHRSRDKALAVWGPRFEGMLNIGKQHDLDHVCAHQWVRCVEKSEQAFAKLDSSKHHQVYYEEFVASPVEVLKGIADFLGLHHSVEELTLACSQVRTSSVGKGKEAASEESAELLAVMQALLDKHNYL